jgi:hypothetical protein
MCTTVKSVLCTTRNKSRVPRFPSRRRPPHQPPTPSPPPGTSIDRWVPWSSPAPPGIALDIQIGSRLPAVPLLVALAAKKYSLPFRRGGEPPRRRPERGKISEEATTAVGAMKPSKKNARKKKKRPSPATPAPPTAADPCLPSETLTLAASETESSSSCEVSSTSAFTTSSSGTASTSSFSASASTASAGDDRRDLAWLLDAFASATIDQVDSAYRGAGGDAFLAAGILGATLDAQPPPPPDHGSAGRKPCRKPKKLACAASGMVADVIGKDYTRPAPSPVSVGNPWKGKGALSASNECKGGAVGRNYSVEDAEQFLCSMLGDNSELGMGVVRDVLGEPFIAIHPPCSCSSPFRMCATSTISCHSCYK